MDVEHALGPVRQERLAASSPGKLQAGDRDLLGTSRVTVYSGCPLSTGEITRWVAIVAARVLCWRDRGVPEPPGVSASGAPLSSHHQARRSGPADRQGGDAVGLPLPRQIVGRRGGQGQLPQSGLDDGLGARLGLTPVAQRPSQRLSGMQQLPCNELRFIRYRLCDQIPLVFPGMAARIGDHQYGVN